MAEAEAATAAAVATLAAPAAAAAAPWTVLCVDDEPHIVSSLRRLLRRAGYRILVAHGGEEALAVLAAEPVDLVISDMRMPGLDGAQLLARVRAGWPGVVRVMLTGQADLRSTIVAINGGEVWRYITKPWDDEALLATAAEAFERLALQRETARLQALTTRQNAALAELNAGLELRVAERTQALHGANEKLRKTYLTSIRMFSNLIELRGGQLAGHSRRVAELARQLGLGMGLDAVAAQELFVAGLLHDMGQICLPDALLARPLPRLDDTELAHYRKHAALGEQALMPLDDMQAVAALVRWHHERHDGQGFPDRLAGTEIPLGARILAVCDNYDELQTGHLGPQMTAAEARTLVARGRGNRFDPEVVDVFLHQTAQAPPGARDMGTARSTDELEPGMVLARELLSADGMLLLAPEQLLTAELIRLLRQRERRDGVPIVLYVKTGAKAAATARAA